MFRIFAWSCIYLVLNNKLNDTHKPTATVLKKWSRVKETPVIHLRLFIDLFNGAVSTEMALDYSVNYDYEYGVGSLGLFCNLTVAYTDWRKENRVKVSVVRPGFKPETSCIPLHQHVRHENVSKLIVWSLWKIYCCALLQNIKLRTENSPPK